MTLGIFVWGAINRRWGLQFQTLCDLLKESVWGTRKLRSEYATTIQYHLDFGEDLTIQYHLQ